MGNPHLNQYCGPLSAKQAWEGITAAQRNAQRLIQDAELLRSNGRVASAVALAILAIEEKGKVVLLRRLSILSDDKDIKLAWRDLRNHRAKNAGWIVPALVEGGAVTAAQLGDAIDSKGAHTSLMDAMKQVHIYADCLGKKHWNNPEADADKDTADALVSMASTAIGSKEVTLREVELWVHHMRPHYGKPSMVSALLGFQKAVHAEGLSTTTEEEMRTFIEGGPQSLH